MKVSVCGGNGNGGGGYHGILVKHDVVVLRGHTVVCAARCPRPVFERMPLVVAALAYPVERFGSGSYKCDIFVASVVDTRSGYGIGAVGFKVGYLYICECDVVSRTVSEGFYTAILSCKLPKCFAVGCVIHQIFRQGNDFARLDAVCRGGSNAKPPDGHALGDGGALSREGYLVDGDSLRESARR